jgi:hypothetical protein
MVRPQQSTIDPPVRQYHGHAGRLKGGIKLSVAAMLQSLFTTAIGRSVPVLYQKIVRRGKVEAAMRGDTLQNSAIKQSLIDYEVIVGSVYGQLTETLDKFLRQLESSGIIVNMAEEAVVGKRTNATRQAFYNLHTEIFADHSGDAERLYNQIASSFAASLELLVADPAIALLIKTISADLTKRLERIEEGTSSLLVAKPIGNQQEIFSTFQKANRALATRYKDVRVETNRGARPVAIERIYIPSKLRVKKEPEQLREILSLDPATRKNRDLILAQSDHSVGRVTYTEFRSGFRRAIVLGDPGGGKSTLCQYLCYQLAKHFNLAEQYNGDPETTQNGQVNFDPQVMKVPLRLVLRSFEGARLSTPQLTIFDYIVNDLKSIITLPTRQLEDFLHYALTYGHAVLAFDGLDEILNTSTRREFVDLVTGFCAEFPLCPVFVTSRLVGYEDAPLPEDFEEFTLEKFDEKEVTQYLIKFLRVFAGEKQAKATERSNVFLKQTEGTAGDLRQNPLMLGLMAFLFATKGDVPTNRPEIYKECAVLMFEKWDQNRNIRADIPLNFDMLHLFGEVASEIYGNPQLEEGVSELWINKKNRKYFLDIYEDRSKAYEAAKKVTGFVTGRSWVMSEFGPDNYQFTHRTFMEYFFARHLDERNETVQELLGALLPHVQERQWDVISHLALQMKTFRHQKRTLQAVERLKEILKQTISEQSHLISVSGFFAKTLTYLVPSEMECKAATIDLTNVAFEIASKEEVEAATSLLQTLCMCVVERREYVRQIITEVLRSRFVQTTNDREFAFCALLLSGDDFIAPHRARSFLTLLPLAEEPIYAELKDDLARRALRDSFSAYLYVEWYRESFAELFEIHGLKMLTADERPWPKNGSRVYPLLVSMVICIGQPMSSPDMTQALRAWGIDAFEVVGRKVDPVRSLASGGPKSQEFRLPPDLWRRGMLQTKTNLYALRGLLFLYRWSDDSIYKLRQGNRNDTAREKDSGLSTWEAHQKNSNRVLRGEISKRLGKLNPQEAGLFEFLRPESKFDDNEPF